MIEVILDGIDWDDAKYVSFLDGNVIHDDTDIEELLGALLGNQWRFSDLTLQEKGELRKIKIRGILTTDQTDAFAVKLALPQLVVRTISL